MDAKQNGNAPAYPHSQVTEVYQPTQHAGRERQVSAQVNVTKLLDDWCQELGIGPSQYDERLVVRDAVAELIEASAAVVGSANMAPEHVRLRAALARLGGAA